MDNCKNCDEPIAGNYCSNCGQPAVLKRIDKHYIVREIKDVFIANKGFFYTIKKLIVAPGKSVRQFIAEDRYRFVKPITFVIICSLLYTVLNHLFQIGVKDYGIYGDEFTPTTARIFYWMLFEHPGYSAILTGLYMAFWIKLFFRKSGHNLFEIFILMCFTSGIGALAVAAVTPFQALVELNILQTTSYIMAVYLIWAVGQFFGERKVMNYVKALFCYILAVLVLSFVIVFIGTLIDVLNGVI